MAVPDQVPSKASIANGLTDVFPYDYLILAEADLLVRGTVDGVSTDYVLNVDYTVDGVGNDSGGNVTFLPGKRPASGVNILRKREMAPQRLEDYQTGGDLRAIEVNKDYDRAIMLIQQLKEAVARALTVRADLVGQVNTELPEPEEGALLGWEGNQVKNLGSVFGVADLTLRPDLASPSVDKGAAMVVYQNEAAGDAAQVMTLRAILDGAELNLLTTFIPPQYHAAIRAHTSTVDVASYVQAAFDFVALFPGVRLYAPSGRYNLGSTLLCPDRLCLRGDGWLAGWTGSAVAEPRGTVFRMIAGSNCDAFRQDGKATRYSMQFADFCIDGDGANQSSNVGPDGTYSIYQFNRNGFFFEALYNTKWTNVRCQNMRGSGWVIHGDAGVGCTNGYLDNCSAYNCRVFCVDFRGATTDFHVNEGDFGFGRCAGIALNSPSCTIRSPVVWTASCQDITHADTHATGTGPVSTTTGGILINGANCRVLGCISEGHAGHGIYVSANASRSLIKDPVIYFVSSGSHSGLYDGISIGNASDILIDSPVVYSQLTGTHNIRRSIAAAAGHTRLRINGGDLRRIGNAAAPVATAVVEGLKSGDVTDYAWQSGRAVAFSNASHSIGTSFTIVQYASEQTDDNNEYDPATYTYTAQEYGPRVIEANLTLTAIDGGEYRLAVFLNGVELRTLQTMRAGSAGSLTLGGTLRHTLAAGDTIDIRCRAVVAAVNTVAGSALSSLVIRQARAD